MARKPTCSVALRRGSTGSTCPTGAHRRRTCAGVPDHGERSDFVSVYAYRFHGPFSSAVVLARRRVREAFCRGREPPPAQAVARLQSYRWFIVGTVCVGSAMSWVDSSITQMLLPRLEWEFGAKLSTVSWVAVAYLLALAAFLPIF